MSVFTKIINREIKAELVYEDEHVIAIHDIAPKAPIHILVIPKKEILSLQSIKEEEMFIIAHMIKAVQVIAKQLKIEKGYRLVVNNGKEAGQTVFHLHFHILAGKTMTENFT
jgi:histidine triad (HIT) family protein